MTVSTAAASGGNMRVCPSVFKEWIPRAGGEELNDTGFHCGGNPLVVWHRPTGLSANSLITHIQHQHSAQRRRHSGLWSLIRCWVRKPNTDKMASNRLRGLITQTVRVCRVTAWSLSVLITLFSPLHFSPCHFPHSVLPSFQTFIHSLIHIHIEEWVTVCLPLPRYPLYANAHCKLLEVICLLS